ncbi:MAG: hypothetical protein AAB354_04140 [candidate division KSB1 bacterium]
MSVAINSRYICDASGNVVEVVLPLAEFQALRQLAGKYLSEWRELTQANGDAHAAELSSAEMTQVALRGGAFDWLKDEPDLYTDEDGEAV